MGDPPRGGWETPLMGERGVGDPFVGQEPTLRGMGRVGAPSVGNEGWETPLMGRGAVGDPCVGWEPTLRGMGGVGDPSVGRGVGDPPMEDGRPL